ncbi:MAG: ABC transporter substrate-binding protein [Methanocella sp.]
MRSSVKAIVFTLVVLAAALGAVPGLAAAPVRIRIGHLPIPGQILHFIAQAKGYFSDEGLDVELTPITSSTNIFNALKAGKLEAAAGGTAAPLIFIANGAPFTIVGGLMGEGTALLVKPADAAKYKNLAAFKGKKIATVRLSTGDVLFRGALKRAGIDPEKDVQFLEFKSAVESIAALDSGKVDAAVSWPPYSESSEVRKSSVVSIWSGAVAPHHTCCRLVVRDDFLKENPDAVVRLLKAYVKAAKFFTQKPEESVQLASQYLKLDAALIRPTLITEKSSYVTPDPQKKEVLDFWERMKQIGYVTGAAASFDVGSKIDGSYFKKALDQVIKENPSDPFYKTLATDFRKDN